MMVMIEFAFILGAILGFVVALDTTINRIKESNEVGASTGHLKHFGRVNKVHSRSDMSSKEYDADCKQTEGLLDRRCKEAVETYANDPGHCEWLDTHRT